MATRHPGSGHSTPEPVGVEEIRETTGRLGRLLVGIAGVLLATVLPAVPAGGVPSDPLSGFVFGFLLVLSLGGLCVGATWAMRVHPDRFDRAVEVLGVVLVPVYVSLGIVLTSAFVFGMLPVNVPVPAVAGYFLPVVASPFRF